MINIENESSLHNTLKVYYASLNNGSTEVKADGHIYDILTADNHVIEIQTKNLGALYKKLEHTLETGKKVTLVHPVAVKNTIYLYDEEGKVLSKRKSSKSGHIYDIFSELTKIYPLLENKNFTLKVLEIKMIEERLKTDKNVQSKNNRRRFRKNWNKINKRLEEILEEHTFSSKQDFIKILPPLPSEFSSKDLKDAMKKQKTPARIYNNPTIILWVLVRMNCIIQTKTEKRFRFYKFV